MKASSLPSTNMDEQCSPEGSKSNMVANHYLPKFINPQHTDKLFSDGRLEHPFSTPRIPHGLPSPFASISAPVSPSSPLESSESSQPYSFELASAPSMNSSPSYPTPSSSNTSSRRHSLISPESQHFYVPEPVSSPTPGPRRSRGGQQAYYGGLKHFQALADTLITTTDPFNGQTPQTNHAEAEVMHDPTLDWQYVGSVHSQQEPGLSMDMQGCLGLDLSAGFDASMCNQLTESGVKHKPDSSSIPPFMTAPARYRTSNQSQISGIHNISPTMLAAPCEHAARASNRFTRSQSLNPCNLRQGRKHGSNSIKRRKASRKPDPPWRAEVVERQRNNGHRCPECGVWFRRPEHLKRHVRKHLSIEQTVLLPCCFAPDCNQRIKDRQDNLRAHLNSTHFKYGKTERGGKNRRYSMRDTMALGLRNEDPRWTLLLEGRIRFGDTENGYWKMLGYSIKETQEIRVKDLIPEWDGPEEMTFQQFDPRWKKLLEGDMTFEQAMEKGAWMQEADSEGLLGVDMKTSEMMGLKKLDPRWRKLLEGGMNVETSDKLGVSHLNPQWLAQQS